MSVGTVANLFLVFWLLFARPDLSITASPRISVAPGYVQIHVHVAIDDRNRAFVWACEGGDFYSRSEEEFTGSGAQQGVEATKTFSRLPAGEYECQAVLIRTNETLRAVTSFLIN